LYNKIKAFLKDGNLLYTLSREAKVNSSPTILFEMHEVEKLNKILIPLMYDNDCILLKTLKAKDFLLRLKLVDPTPFFFKGGLDPPRFPPSHEVVACVGSSWIYIIKVIILH
jgi:hypothetical protein